MDDMPRPRPPHLVQQTTRHGAVVWYVRKGKGPRARLRAAYGTVDFWREYRAALDGSPAAEKRKVAPMTLEWALDRYRASSAWAALSPATRLQREAVLKRSPSQMALDACTKKIVQH